MSKWRIGLAGVAVLVLTTLLPTEAPAGMRIGLNPIGVARMAVGRVLSIGRIRHARAHARRGYTRTAALRSQSIGRGPQAGAARPAGRQQNVAGAAPRGPRDNHHRDGGGGPPRGGYG